MLAEGLTTTTTCGTVGITLAGGLPNEDPTGVNLQSDGLPNEPKKTHLQRLHHLLAKYADYLLDSPSQVSNKQKILVYNTRVRAHLC